MATCANSVPACSTSYSKPRVGNTAHLRAFAWATDHIFASAPKLIEQVLITDAKHYIKHFGARAYKPVRETDWSRARASSGFGNASSFNSYFSRLGCSLMKPLMGRLTERMLDTFTSGKTGAHQ